jgi:hypothetical protein
MKVRIYPPATVTVPPTTVTVPLATVTNVADPQDQQSAGQPGRAYPAQEQGYPESETTGEDADAWSDCPS